MTYGIHAGAISIVETGQGYLILKDYGSFKAYSSEEYSTLEEAEEALLNKRYWLSIGDKETT